MKTKIKVSRAALMARINRKIQTENEWLRLRKARSESAIRSVGEYYLVDLNRNAIVDQHVDPEDYAREIGVLADYEAVAD